MKIPQETGMWRPSVEWVVERRGVTLLRPGEGVICSVPYPYAAVWDGMVRGFDTRRMLRMLSWVARVDEDEGRRMLAACLGNWQEARLIAEDGPSA